MPMTVNAYLFDSFGNPILGATAFPPSQPITEKITLINATVTRPGNTTAYAPGQAWGTAGSCLFTFAGSVAAGARGKVQTARLTKTNNVITNASFRLWLHNTTPGTVPAADQAAMNLAMGDRFARIGFFTWAACFSAGQCADGNATPSMDGGLPFDMAGVETALIGILEVTGAYVPISSESMFIELGIRPE